MFFQTVYAKNLNFNEAIIKAMSVIIVVNHQ